MFRVFTRPTRAYTFLCLGPHSQDDLIVFDAADVVGVKQGAVFVVVVALSQHRPGAVGYRRVWVDVRLPVIDVDNDPDRLAVRIDDRLPHRLAPGRSGFLTGPFQDGQLISVVQKTEGTWTVPHRARVVVVARRCRLRGGCCCAVSPGGSVGLNCPVSTAWIALTAVPGVAAGAGVRSVAVAGPGAGSETAGAPAVAVD